MRRRGMLGASALVMAALAVAALSSAVASGCKESFLCAPAGCPNDPNQIAVHVHTPARELLTATTTACWGSKCVTLVVPKDGGADADLDGDLPLVGADFARGVLVDEGDGWTRIETSVPVATTEMGGVTSIVRPANGDDYRVSVKAADGTPLVDVDRSITYNLDRPSSDCQDECLSAAISVYVGSPSGACTAIACDNAVSLHLRFADQDDAAQARVTVCRNGRCAIGRGTGFGRVDGTSSDLRVRVDGHDYRGPLEVTLIVDGENAALADGDRYTVEVDHVAAPPTKLEASAVYETSFPNGHCDPYPCRRIRFEVP